LLVACGGGGGGGGSTTPDTTPPVLTLATSSPAPVTTTVVFTSDEDLSGTVSVTVKNGTTTVAGATALGASGRSIVWTPSASLAFSTSFSVSASAADLSGNVGTATGVVTTVANPADTTPPVLTLATSSPASVTTTIVFTSNEDLSSPFSVTVKNGTVTVAGATALGASNRSLVWTPSASLAFSTSYSVSASAADLSGNVGTATGVVTTVADPTAPVLHYNKVIIGVRFGRPGVISATGNAWTQATNNTSYQSGVIPIYNAMVSEAPLPDGSFLELVQAASDGDLHFVSHNPVTNVLTDYTGVVPPGYEVVRTGPSSWNIGAKWHSVPWGTAPYAYMNAWAENASGGTVYTDYTDDRILRYRDASGALSVLYTSTDGGSFSVLISISN
jgi:hypothetical protein